MASRLFRLLKYADSSTPNPLPEKYPVPHVGSDETILASVSRLGTLCVAVCSLQPKCHLSVESWVPVRVRPVSPYVEGSTVSLSRHLSPRLRSQGSCPY